MSFNRNNSGQGLIGYALLLVLVAVVVLVILSIVLSSPQWKLLIATLQEAL